MLVVLGLGNPGNAYRGTRHNLGKEVVGSLVDELGLRARPGKGEYSFAEDRSRDLLLVIPTTYMNISGRAAAQALEHFGAAAPDLLAVCDDFALPLGTLRIRKQGSDGGHNGLASIIYHLGSEDFPRLRMGVGPVPAGVVWTDFVLSAFEPSEAPLAVQVVSTAREAVLAVAASGVEAAQNRYNVTPSPGEQAGGGPDERLGRPRRPGPDRPEPEGA